MARRSDHTREVLTELILANAMEIIDLHGFQGLTARGLAKAVGYSVGTLYHIFGTFETLVLQVNGRTLDGLQAALAESIIGKDGVPALHALAKAYLEFSRVSVKRWSMLFEVAMEAHDLPDWYRQKLDGFFTLVEGVVLPVVRHDERAAYETARVLWAGLHGICVLAATDKLSLMGAASPERLSHNLIDTYIYGLGLKPRD